jgi:hypothetical protein
VNPAVEREGVTCARTPAIASWNRRPSQDDRAPPQDWIMANDLTARQEPTRPRADVWQHTTSLGVALVFWVAALAAGVAAGAITDASPASEETHRQPRAVATGGQGPPTTPATTAPVTTEAPPPTQPPTTALATGTTAPPPTDDSDNSDEDSEDAAEARCDAAQTAAENAQAALDDAYQTLTDLTEAQQAATDAEAHAQEACTDD